MENFFGGEILPSTFLGEDKNLPKINIKETSDDYFVSIAKPGLHKEDFKINLINEVLTVSANVNIENSETEEKGNVLRREFNYTAFTRTFTVPQCIDESKINATYLNGIFGN